MFDAKAETGQMIQEGLAKGMVIVRRYGKFATTTTGELVKVSNGEIIPTDEPVYMFRGRDRLAIKLLLVYRELSEADGCNEWHMDRLRELIQVFRDFAREHPERMKQPSITRGR